MILAPNKYPSSTQEHSPYSKYLLSRQTDLHAIHDSHHLLWQVSQGGVCRFGFQRTESALSENQDPTPLASLEASGCLAPRYHGPFHTGLCAQAVAWPGILCTKKYEETQGGSRGTRFVAGIRLPPSRKKKWRMPWVAT